MPLVTLDTINDYIKTIRERSNYLAQTCRWSEWSEDIDREIAADKIIERFDVINHNLNTKRERFAW